MPLLFPHFTKRLLPVLCVVALAAGFALAQDVTKVAPGSVKVIFENDSVRILDSRTMPGSKVAMHSHPDMLAVVLEPGSTKFTTPEGKSRQAAEEARRGTVVYTAAESHTSENVGKTLSRAILVEFKKPAPAAAEAANPSLPAPYKQAGDNAHARVFEVNLAPGGSVPMHTHGEHVIVALTDGTAEVTDATGQKQSEKFQKDTAIAGGPTTHSAVNTGKMPLHLIVVELK